VFHFAGNFLSCPMICAIYHCMMVSINWKVYFDENTSKKFQ